MFVELPIRSITYWFLLLVILYLFTTFGFSITRIAGDSMLPNLHHGEWVVISKYEPWLKVLNYKRGDIIYFHHPSDKKRLWFIPVELSNTVVLTKRILALAGETIKIEKGQVFINNEPLEESYLKGIGGFSMSEKRILKDQIFAMGDNRMPLGSIDSRHFGTIAKGDILGRVWSLY